MPTPTQKKDITAAVRMSPELYAEMQKAAQALGISYANLMRQLLKEYLQTLNQ